MKKGTYLISACIILLLAGILYYFVKDEPMLPPKEPKQQAKNVQGTTLSYIGNKIVEEKDGKPLWELGAESIEVDINGDKTQLNAIKGVFYQENGGKIDITAPKAVVDNKTKNIVMTGKVKAVASDGASFTSQEVQWFSEEKRFYGQGEVVLTKDDTVMTGEKIESNANMEKIKVYGNAKVVKGGASK